MTEKRFTIKYGKYIDNENNIEYDEKWESWKICELLNELHEENQELKSFNKELAENLSVCANARISKDNRIERLEERNKELKDKLFEAEKDYLIETSDISDKLYLDEEINKLKKEVYGDMND